MWIYIFNLNKPSVTALTGDISLTGEEAFTGVGSLITTLTGEVAFTGDGSLTGEEAFTGDGSLVTTLTGEAKHSKYINIF